jgi:hypothetical protein
MTGSLTENAARCEGGLGLTRPASKPPRPGVPAVKRKGRH